MDRIGIHESASDPIPHMTLAAATSQMRKDNQSVIVHSRVSSPKVNQAWFQGSRAYDENVLDDEPRLRASYSEPIPVRTTLMAQDEHTSPVGCILDADGTLRWYVLNDQQQMVYIDGFFYRVGEGARANLAFLHPVLNRTCKALFLGHERPATLSPDPRPTNLGYSMSALDLAGGYTVPDPETVQLRVHFGKDMAKVLRFNVHDGTEMRASWKDWERVDDAEGRHLFSLTKDGKEFWTTSLPGELVQPWFKDSSDRPIQFRNCQGEVFKTKRSKWIPGKRDTFFVYLENKVFYVALNLPLSKEDR